MRKFRHQNKQLKIEQLLNQTFYPKKPSKFKYYMVCQLRDLIYCLNACYTILYPSGTGSVIQSINKTNEL